MGHFNLPEDFGGCLGTTVGIPTNKLLTNTPSFYCQTIPKLSEKHCAFTVLYALDWELVRIPKLLNIIITKALLIPRFQAFLVMKNARSLCNVRGSIKWLRRPQQRKREEE